MEPVEGVESVPKSRWKLVSERSEGFISHAYVFRTAISASKKWVPVSNAATEAASRHFTLLVVAEQDYT
jgi:hypothetical protein